MVSYDKPTPFRSPRIICSSIERTFISCATHKFNTLLVFWGTCGLTTAVSSTGSRNMNANYNPRQKSAGARYPHGILTCILINKQHVMVQVWQSTRTYASRQIQLRPRTNHWTFRKLCFTKCMMFSYTGARCVRKRVTVEDRLHGDHKCLKNLYLMLLVLVNLEAFIS